MGNMRVVLLASFVIGALSSRGHLVLETQRNVGVGALPIDPNAASTEGARVAPELHSQRTSNVEYHFCNNAFSNDEKVVAVVDDPSRAMVLPSGTRGTALCNSSRFQVKSPGSVTHA